ncbi:lipopolysaccharide biosynthesis protein [Bilifractor sp. LCP21S3_A7]|uniref:lipopolysaccharide biosynthesis protein n=1 Tax=Bilifractor sp. LCP21S3_A7 TaxID=3438738 RepID=UPI003F922CB0
MDTFKNTRVISGFIWRFMERVGAQLVQFIVSIVLARILNPSAYGTVALITVFTTIMQVFVDSGLGNALIQKKNADDIDFSTVFYTNIVFCLLLYGVMWLFAPAIAGFYHQPELVPYVRVLSLTIVVSGVKNVQQAYVSRNMLFKRFFFATLAGTIGAAVLGITLALHGAGVWAIIAQQLFNLTVDTCVLWITVKWRPIKAFSFQRLKGLFSFGWKLLVSALIDTGYNNLRQLLIGKIYSPSDLAYYNQGDKFPAVIVNNINTSIDSVLLPAMSSEQDHKDHVRNMTRRAIKTSTYIMAPLMIGLAACSREVISLILTDKWLPCVPYLQIFCFTYMIWPLHTANLNAIKALGRSDMFLKLEIIKKCVGLTLLLITMRISVLAMAISLLISGVCSLIINSWPNRGLLNYKVEDQIKDILPNIIMALIMGTAVFGIGSTPFPTVLRLIVQIVVGAGIYYILSRITKNDTYFYAVNLIKQHKDSSKE